MRDCSVSNTKLLHMKGLPFAENEHLEVFDDSKGKMETAYESTSFYRSVVN